MHSEPKTSKNFKLQSRTEKPNPIMATTEHHTAAMEKAPNFPNEANIEHEKVEAPMEPQHMPIRQKRTSTAADLENYNFQLAIDSWDQIGSLTSEVATSVLSQVAEGMSEQMRQDTRAAKRRKFLAQQSEFSSEPTLVSSDDECNVVDDPPISRTLSKQIDRMARMSKYMMQIENYHHLLRNEMMAIVNDDDDL
jgi:hypothetical protein